MSGSTHPPVAVGSIGGCVPRFPPFSLLISPHTTLAVGASGRKEVNTSFYSGQLQRSLLFGWSLPVLLRSFVAVALRSSLFIIENQVEFHTSHF